MDYRCFYNDSCVSLAIFYAPRRITIASRVFYQLLIAMELFILLSIFIFVSTIIRIIWRSPIFHPNLRGMITFLLAHSYIHIIARIPLILYQKRFIRLDLSDSADILEIILISASILRLYHGLSLIFLYCATVIERMCATVYIRDYESKRRMYISISLRIAVVAISLLLSLDLTFEFLQVSYNAYFGFIFTCSTTSATISVFLYLYNRQRMEYVLKHAHAYSLSLRYQLIENMRAFTFLQVITTAGVVGITVNCLVLMTPHYVLQDDLNARALCGASFEMLYALTFLAGIMICFFTQSVWKKELTLKLRNFLRRHGSTGHFTFVDITSVSSAKGIKIAPNAALTHFSDLTKTWDMRFTQNRK